MAEAGDFERPFFMSVGSLKVELDWDEEEEKEILKLDGTLHSELPWLPEDWRKSKDFISHLNLIVQKFIHLSTLFACRSR